MSESTNLFEEQSNDNDNKARHIPVVNRSPLSLVFNEDCKVIMKRFSDGHFDLAIVDPPYGLGIDGQEESICKNPKHNRKEHERKNWDKSIPDAEYFSELFRVSKNQIIWGGNYFVKYLTEGHKGWIVWDKGQRGLTMSDCELAYTSFDNPTRVFVQNRVVLLQERTIHPTQKPIILYDYCLSLYAKPGFKILDTHLGSGSSRIACEKAGLDFVGCELDEKIYNNQEKRFKDHLVQGRLFNADFC